MVEEKPVQTGGFFSSLLSGVKEIGQSLAKDFEQAKEDVRKEYENNRSKLSDASDDEEGEDHFEEKPR